jgi:hypothetical protein
MSIRPLDLQVMIPQLQEVSRISHLDQQKGQLQQQNIANTLNKNTLSQEQTVTTSHEQDKTKNEQDAKEEGKNGYYSNPRDRKNNQNKQENNDEADNQTPRHKIDIKI